MSEIAGFKKCPKCGFFYEDWRARCPICPADGMTVVLLLAFAVLMFALFGCALRPPNVVCVPYEEYQKMSLKECR